VLRQASLKAAVDVLPRTALTIDVVFSDVRMLDGWVCSVSMGPAAAADHQGRSHVGHCGSFRCRSGIVRGASSGPETIQCSRDRAADQKPISAVALRPQERRPAWRRSAGHKGRLSPRAGGSARSMPAPRSRAHSRIAHAVIWPHGGVRVSPCNSSARKALPSLHFL